MTYEELKKAYKEMSIKCSELEKKIEDKDLEIENLTEQLLKRNQMLFGRKSERSKYLNVDGQIAFDESFLVNEAEERSDENMAEPDAETVTEEPKKKHAHRGELCIRICRKKLSLSSLMRTSVLVPNVRASCMSLLPNTSRADWR